MRGPVRRALAISVSLACLCASAGLADIDVPFLTGRVVDNAAILRPETRARLTEAMKAHEQATGNQIAVLTVPTIQPVSIEEYAVKVFQAWKLGQKGKDNGVLIVVVPQDRKMRIEVGYGLEPTLPDGAAGAIIRDLMTPEFKNSDYDKGIEAGVTAVIAQLEGRGTLPADPVAARSRDAHSVSVSGLGASHLPWPQRILMGAFIFGIIGLFTVIGVLTPGVARR